MKDQALQGNVIESQELSQQPEQLGLFNDTSVYGSQAFRVIDRFLSFIFGKSNRKRESGKYLPSVKTSIFIGGHEVVVSMTPARIRRKNVEKDYYPSIKDLSMFDAVFKSSSANGNTAFHYVKGFGEALMLGTSINDARGVFRSQLGKDTFNYSDAMLSFEILRKTYLEFSVDGKTLSGSLISLGLTDESSGSLAAMAHPLLSRMVKLGAFREINFLDQVKLKKLLSKFLHRLLADRYTYASKKCDQSYQTKLSRVKEDYVSLEDAGDLRKQNHKMKESLEELKDNGIISKYEITPIKDRVNGRLRITDYKYEVWNSVRFAEEQIEANKKRKQSFKALTAPKIKRSDFDSQNEFHKALQAEHKKLTRINEDQPLSPDELIVELFQLN